MAISGDFNHATLAPTLPTFKQFVDCPTRENKTLDLLYANVKEAYSSTALPPLERSDRNLIHLRPLYKPLIQWLPMTTGTEEMVTGDRYGFTGLLRANRLGVAL